MVVSATREQQVGQAVRVVIDQHGLRSVRGYSAGIENGLVVTLPGGFQDAPVAVDDGENVLTTVAVIVHHLGVLQHRLRQGCGHRVVE